MAEGTDLQQQARASRPAAGKEGSVTGTRGAPATFPGDYRAVCGISASGGTTPSRPAW
jgi:hypothetical protein